MAEHFDRVETLFAEAADLTAETRVRALDAACAGRPQLRHEVEALLAAHDRMAMMSPDEEARPGIAVGSRIGAYQIVEQIGEGGMGEVYRAERVDGAFTQQVAVKVTRSALMRDDLIRRFKVERKILASLHHASIVTLLDAGATPDGQAYFVMEYVEGTPITLHCRQRALSLEARLRIVRVVCGAVQHAHQHGIVHRDLKPANILLGPDGAPKVLDFGLAKLINDPSDSGLTALSQFPGPLTPNYASPEQLRGLAVTTASDVYAIGVLLYELVTGVRPYETQGHALDHVLDMVVHTDPVRPSDVHVTSADSEVPYPLRRLKGDVDAIILKAMRKEPSERYDSAGEFASDITRVLEGHPVLARAPSTAYVLRRLAARHATLVTVVALAVLGILTVSGAAIWQRQVARHQQALAERRFNEVRQLANSLVFKVHDAVAPLPGSTPVRQMIVNEGLAYLERLTAEVADDPQLQLESARAYIQIGTVQGYPNRANLGDRQGAIASFRKAEAILRPMASAPEASPPIVGAYVNATNALSETLFQTVGQREEAVAAAKRGTDVAETLVRRQPTSDDARRALAGASFTAALTADPADRLTHWQRALQMYQALLAEGPDDAVRQRNVALVEKYLGGAYEARQDYASALEHHRVALRLDEARARHQPDDRVVTFDLAIDLSNIAYAHWLRQEFAEAETLYKRSLLLREQLASSDAKDVLGLAKVAFVRQQLGLLKSDQKHDDEAMMHLREALKLYERTDTTTLDTKLNMARILARLGQLETASHQSVGCRSSTRAFDLFASMTDAAGTLNLGDHLRRAATDAAACGVLRAQRWLAASTK